MKRPYPILKKDYRLEVYKERSPKLQEEMRLAPLLPVRPKEDQNIMAQKRQTTKSAKAPKGLYEKIKTCALCPRELTCKGLGPTLLPLEEKLIPQDILFLLDFPQANESHKDKLLYGDRGELLKKIIQAMGICPQKHHISYATKCYGPSLIEQSNKAQQERELMKSQCYSHLLEEIRFLKPKVIVSFGAYATNLLMGKKMRLSIAHGQFFKKEFVTQEQEKVSFEFMPVFHPDYLLINPNMKKAAWADLQKVMAKLKK